MSSLSLLETDYKCDDYGRDSGYCKHCSESAFDKSNDEEMSEMSSKEYEDVSAVLLALKKEMSLQTTTQSSYF